MRTAQAYKYSVHVLSVQIHSIPVQPDVHYSVCPISVLWRSMKQTTAGGKIITTYDTRGQARYKGPVIFMINQSPASTNLKFVGSPRGGLAHRSSSHVQGDETCATSSPGVAAAGSVNRHVTYRSQVNLLKISEYHNFMFGH